MKTSFARTFQDLSVGQETSDKVFPDRETERVVTDQDGDEVRGDDVVVILSYDEELGPTEATSTLLVNAELRKEYEQIQADVLVAKDKLISAISPMTGAKKLDVSQSISRAFTKDDDFLTALTRVHDEVANQEGAPYAEVPYGTVFNEKVRPLLYKAEFKEALSDYVTRLNELLDSSRFFNRETFNYYHATNVTKNLRDNGFFDADHAVVLNDADGQPVEVNDAGALERIVAEEKMAISDDAGLTQKLESIEKQLNRNMETRTFHEFISSHLELLPELQNPDLLEERIWKSYLKTHVELYGEVVECHRSAMTRKRQIEQQAAKERTQWERVIDIFNQRFFVPFRLTAKNRNQVVLGQETILELGFVFEDGPEHAAVERDDLLRVLSNGEKKALYILNVLFEVEARKSSQRDTLFVVDDIADSFDYKNKYAIVHYLKEMTEQANFRLVILTHNFDFFRTVESRRIATYPNCLSAHRDGDAVVLRKAVGIRNPFINDFKPNFHEDRMKRVASIPFIRNIAEYTTGDQDPHYLRLTSLLHWKTDTSDITNSDLDAIFGSVFSSVGFWPAASDFVVDDIFTEADVAVAASEGMNFAHKIVLSIAIRLRAEQHMVDELGGIQVTSSIQGNQTQELFKKYRSQGLGDDESRRVLELVALMTPENIHVNSFMYEPIIDMSDAHLRQLYGEVRDLA